MIPLTELAAGNATGRADLARRNLMKADGKGKTGKLLYVILPFEILDKHQLLCTLLANAVNDANELDSTARLWR